eukprot:417740_1
MSDARPRRQRKKELNVEWKQYNVTNCTFYDLYKFVSNNQKIFALKGNMQHYMCDLNVRIHYIKHGIFSFDPNKANKDNIGWEIYDYKIQVKSQVVIDINTNEIYFLKKNINIYDIENKTYETKQFEGNIPPTPYNA